MTDPPQVVHVLWTRCYPCQFGEHRDPAEWHTWASREDIEHAAATKQADPSDQPCGCPCSGAAPAPAEQQATAEALGTLAARIHRSMPASRPE